MSKSIQEKQGFETMRLAPEPIRILVKRLTVDLGFSAAARTLGVDVSVLRRVRNRFPVRARTLRHIAEATARPDVIELQRRLEKH